MKETVMKALTGLISFNNFYYCRFILTLLPPCERLISFNNFYYCRLEHVAQWQNLANKLQ